MSISRRDFLKGAAASAAAMGLGSGAAGLLPLSGKRRKKGGGRRGKR